jgi:Tfp pilus assembly protein PilF
VDRVPDALKELQTALELNPDHYRANLLMGRICALQGDPSAGLPHLEKAVKLTPTSREAHLFLADAYEKLGRETDAQRERAAAERAGASKRR